MKINIIKKGNKIDQIIGEMDVQSEEIKDVIRAGKKPYITIRYTFTRRKEEIVNVSLLRGELMWE
jgi:hypothetical protein